MVELGIIGIVFGVFVQTFVQLGVYFAIFCILLGTSIFILFQKKYAYIFAFLFCVALGIIRMDIAQNVSMQGDKLFYNGEYIDAVVRVVDEPDVRASNTLVTVEQVGLNNSKILLFTDQYTEFNYGDVVHIYGKIQKPKKIYLNDKRVFDYPHYLKKSGIHFVMHYPKIELVKDAQISLQGLLFNLKHSYLQNISQIIPDPESALAGGITVGDKRSLGKDLLNDFRITGIIHIVVLSGYNVSIIAIAVFSILGFVYRPAAIVLSIILIAMFALLVGGGATVVRAASMGVLALLALQFGRNYNIMRSLLIVGVMMILWNPYTLVYDVSFQLSFVATLGLILIYPILYEKFTYLSEAYGIRALISATLSAQIAVLPLIVYYMGDISLVSLPVNIIVVPVLTVAMGAVFLTGVLGWVSGALAIVPGLIAYIVLKGIFVIVAFFKSLPFAFVHISVISFSWVIIAYVILALWIWNNKKGMKNGEYTVYEKLFLQHRDGVFNAKQVDIK